LIAGIKTPGHPRFPRYRPTFSNSSFSSGRSDDAKEIERIALRHEVAIRRQQAPGLKTSAWLS